MQQCSKGLEKQSLHADANGFELAFLAFLDFFMILRVCSSCRAPILTFGARPWLGKI